MQSAPFTTSATSLLTPGEVATMFRVDPKTVTRWANAGKITAVRTLGGHRRFVETEIRSLLSTVPAQQGCAGGGPPTPRGGGADLRLRCRAHSGRRRPSAALPGPPAPRHAARPPTMSWWRSRARTWARTSARRWPRTPASCASGTPCADRRTPAQPTSRPSSGTSRPSGSTAPRARSARTPRAATSSRGSRAPSRRPARTCSTTTSSSARRGSCVRSTTPPRAHRSPATRRSSGTVTSGRTTPCSAVPARSPSSTGTRTCVRAGASPTSPTPPGAMPT